MSIPELGPCPPRLAELKRSIAEAYPDFEARVTRAWEDVLAELVTATAKIASTGSEVCLPSYSCLRPH